MNKLTEIAKANGAKPHKDYDVSVGSYREYGDVVISYDQLRATIEQVCAPLVEALKSIRAEAYNKDDGDYFEKADLALMNHRALIGDKHE